MQTIAPANLAHLRVLRKVQGRRSRLASSSPSRLEHQTSTQLQLAPEPRSVGARRAARRVHQRINEGPTQVEWYLGWVRETGAEHRNLIVETYKVRPVEEVECLSHQLEVNFLTQFEL